MSHVPYFLQSTTKLGTRPGRTKSKNLREAAVVAHTCKVTLEEGGKRTLSSMPS